MATAPTQLTQADAHRKAGQFAEAESEYRQVLATQPDHLDALIGLGRSLSSLGQHSAGVACLGRALSLQPDHPEARWALGQALHVFAVDLAGHGQGVQATAMFRQALQFNPGLVDTHLQLGDLLKGQGQPAEAVRHYERAVALKPDSIEALTRLGMLHAEANRSLEAIKWYQWALAVVPDDEEAHFNLAAMLECEARLAEAQIHRRRAQRPMPLIVETAPEPRRTVLIPWAAGTGNVPIDTLMPRATTTRIKWIVECATDAQEAELPPHDVVFNAIGNAEIAAFSLERMLRFCQGRTVLNHPERVMATRRDLLPDLLAGLPDVLVPRIIHVRRDEIPEDGLAARLAETGLPFPLIVRPVSCQGGKGAQRVNTEAQLAEALASDADGFYIIAFHDSTGPDGYFRKYRMIFVDGRPYPYHLAISQNWLVHYQTANMLEAPWKREEERRFLEAPVETLGPRAYAAIEAIGHRLGLDYAGIDFAVIGDGTILVFEANATMLVHLQDAPELFPAKHAAVPKIFRAFEALLDRAIARAKATP
jgi:Flp pilus assembly protein TadD